MAPIVLEQERHQTSSASLCEVGFTANRRLLDVQLLSHDPARGQETFTAANDSVITTNGTGIAGLRLADTRAQALLCALLVFRLLPAGFTNRDLTWSGWAAAGQNLPRRTVDLRTCAAFVLMA